MNIDLIDTARDISLVYKIFLPLEIEGNLKYHVMAVNENGFFATLEEFDDLKTAKHFYEQGIKKDINEFTYKFETQFNVVVKIKKLELELSQPLPVEVISGIENYKKLQEIFSEEKKEVKKTEDKTFLEKIVGIVWYKPLLYIVYAGIESHLLIIEKKGKNFSRLLYLKYRAGEFAQKLLNL